jgi:hypothetical protein
MRPARLLAPEVRHAGIMARVQPTEEVRIPGRRDGRGDPDVAEAQAERFGLEAIAQILTGRGGETPGF